MATETLLTVKQVAAICGRSEPWVHKAVREGYIKKEARGKYRLDTVVKGVIAHYEALLQDATKQSAANRASDARTRETEIRIAERTRKLIPLIEAQEAIAELAALPVTEFNALPARLSRDLDDRKKIQAEIDAIFRKLSDFAEQKSAALRTGGEALEAE